MVIDCGASIFKFGMAYTCKNSGRYYLFGISAIQITDEKHSVEEEYFRLKNLFPPNRSNNWGRNFIILPAFLFPHQETSRSNLEENEHQEVEQEQEEEEEEEEEQRDIVDQFEYESDESHFL